MNLVSHVSFKFIKNKAFSKKSAQANLYNCLAALKKPKTSVTETERGLATMGMQPRTRRDAPDEIMTEHEQRLAISPVMIDLVRSHFDVRQATAIFGEDSIDMRHHAQAQRLWLLHCKHLIGPAQDGESS